MSPTDHGSDPRRPIFVQLSCFAIPLVTYLAVRGFAASQANPAGAAESAFLGLLIGGVVAAIAALGTTRELTGTALLALTSIWIVDYGPHRGALVVALLAAGLALAAGRRWLREQGALPARLTVPVALGLQLLVRCDLLLPPLLNLRTLVSVLVLPVLAGLATTVLAERHGVRRALYAAGAAVILAPGWNVTTTLALVCLAAGSLLGDTEAARWQRGLAGAVLVGAAVVKPPIGALLALGGLALALPWRWSWGTLPAALLATLILAPSRGWPEALALWISGLLILPALALAPTRDRRPALVGLAIAFAGARLGPEGDALAGGLALAALALPELGAAASLQAVWSGTWLAGTGLLAAYPWLRETPREDALALVGLAPGAIALVGLMVGVVALALACDALAPRLSRWGLTPARVGGFAVFAALVVGLPRQSTVALSYDAMLLSDHQPIWTQAVTPASFSQLVVDSSLIRGATLETGTPVARIQLLDDDDRALANWDLLAGQDTAEWAAARPDVADRPGFEAPPPWLSPLAPDGTFFAQRFRARFRVYQPAKVAAVRIARHRQLPAQVELVIFRVELRR